MEVLKAKTVDTLAKITGKVPCGGVLRNSVFKLVIYQLRLCVVIEGPH